MRIAHQLDDAAGAEMLRRAVASRCSIVLEFATAPGRTVSGTLVSCDDASMLVEVSGRPALEWDKLVGVACEARIYDDQRYSATTRVLALPAWGNTLAIALAHPASLRVLDRRRFHRAKLAPSSEVDIEWKVDGVARRQTVKLLNVSTDGMACRIDQSAAAGLTKRQRLRVGFAIPGAEQRVQLEARITNLTPASAGSFIVGLQFMASKGDAAAIRALRIAIERADSVANDEKEVCV